jgi:hypothetical protein
MFYALTLRCPDQYYICKCVNSHKNGGFLHIFCIIPLNTRETIEGTRTRTQNQVPAMGPGLSTAF